MLLLLDGYKDKMEINTFDFSKDPGLAKKYHIFFPTLTIIDNKYRFYNPLRKRFLDYLIKGQIPHEEPYRPEIGREKVEKLAEPLTADNLVLACDCCGSKTDANCYMKRRFLSDAGQELYGYIHKDEYGHLLGGAEFLPSKLVPYDIPKGDDMAFITCVYMTDSKFDYKSYPLKKLELSLSQSFNKILAITDEVGVFPNGDLQFFLDNGYTDDGVIYEDSNYCKLHLVSKRL
jgi:hypothetical protein